MKLIFSSVLLTLLSGCTLPGSIFEPPEPVRIGGVFDLSRKLSCFDAPASRGAQMAVDEINASGGLLGNRIEFHVRDTTTSGKKIRHNLEQLIYLEKIHALMGFSDTDQVIAGDPVVQAAGIPFVTVGATSPRIAGTFGSGSTLILAAAGDNALAAVAAEYAFRNFGPKGLVVFENSKDSPVLQSRYFIKRFEELGGHVLGSMYYVGSPPRLVPVTRRLKGSLAKPDFVFLASMPVNAPHVIRQLRASGIKAPVMGTPAFDTEEIRQMDPAVVGSIYFTAHAVLSPGSQSSRVRGFVEKYRTRYGREPENAFAALGYDAAMLLAEGIRQSGSFENAKVLEAIQSLRDFEGVTGAVTYGPNRRVPFRNVSIVKLGTAGVESVSEQMPEKMPVP